MSHPKHPLLSDPTNLLAYQTLSYCPNGSSRSWAKKAGWAHSKMVRFLAALEKAGLATIESRGRGGSTFTPTVPKRSETFRPLSSSSYPGSSKAPTKLPRYADANGTKKPSPAEIENARPFVDFLNAEMSRRFGDEYVPIQYDQKGSCVAAAKMLRHGEPEATLEYFKLSVREYTPDKGAGVPRSAGHPFFLNGVAAKAKAARRHRKDPEQLEAQLFVLTSTPQKPKAVTHIADSLKKYSGGAA